MMRQVIEEFIKHVDHTYSSAADKLHKLHRVVQITSVSNGIIIIKFLGKLIVNMG